MTSDTPPPAGLLYRLAALLYDTLLLLAVLFIATALLLPLTHGEAMAPGNPFYSSYLLFVSFFFFGWFWMHGGQTLGMRAWRLQLRRIDGGPLTWWHVLLRFLSAIPSWALLGVGFWWMLVDKRRLALHDRISETCIVRLSENPHRWRRN
jgi:uncharacterized RDD family membrane protein YckC